MDTSSELDDLFYTLLQEYGGHVDIFEKRTNMANVDWSSGKTAAADYLVFSGRVVCLPSSLKIFRGQSKIGFERVSRSYLTDAKITFGTEHHIIEDGNKYEVTSVVDHRKFVELVCTVLGEARHE